jgi:hypothetical protein
MDRSMVAALLVNLAAFTLLYVSFLAARMIVAREEARLVAARPVAGAAVISPPGLSDA